MNLEEKAWGINVVPWNKWFLEGYFFVSYSISQNMDWAGFHSQMVTSYDWFVLLIVWGLHY